MAGTGPPYANLFVSDIISSGGKALQVLDAWRESPVELLIGPDILQEIGEVLR